jgi:hypothetical protein
MALLAASNFENNQQGIFGYRGQCSIDATSKLSGTYSGRVNLNGSGAINSNFYYAYGTAVDSYYQYFKFLYAPTSLFRSVAGSTYGINDDMVLWLYLDSDNKMKFLCYTLASKGGGFAGAGTVALSASTKYRVQVYYSKNGGPNSRAFVSVKIHTDAGVSVDSFSAEHPSSAGQQLTKSVGAIWTRRGMTRRQMMFIMTIFG